MRIRRREKGKSRAPKHVTIEITGIILITKLLKYYNTFWFNTAIVLLFILLLHT